MVGCPEEEEQEDAQLPLFAHFSTKNQKKDRVQSYWLDTLHTSTKVWVPAQNFTTVTGTPQRNFGVGWSFRAYFCVESVRKI